MEYCVSKMILSGAPRLTISENEYHEIQLASSGLVEVLGIEQKFDVFINNFLEFETELAAMAVREMTFRGGNYIDLHAQKDILNRRLVNILSSARLFIDHSSHHVSNLVGPFQDSENPVKVLASKEYDEFQCYRIMEALRNYVQHRGFPIHSVSIGWRRIEKNGEEKVCFSISPRVKPEELEQDGKFKAAVLAEIKLMGGEIDLRPIIKGYVSCLGSINTGIRDLLSSKVSCWDKTFSDFIERYRAKFPEETISPGLAALRTDGEKNLYDPVYLSDNMKKYREHFTEKNSSFVSFDARYIET